MRRRSASPDADTMSHWPAPPSFIRLTISSDEPAGFWLTLHPVAAVKGSTQDLSAYPSHSTRLSWPSPGPIDACGAIDAVGGCFAVEPPVDVVEPQAVTVIKAAVANVPSRTHMAGSSVDLILASSPCCSLPLLVSHPALVSDRARKYARAPMQAGYGDPQFAALRLQPQYSGAPPQAARPGPSAR